LSANVAGGETAKSEGERDEEFLIGRGCVAAAPF
jgi:hypothetical protein